jgi:hypothetical protein
MCVKLLCVKLLVKRRRSKNGVEFVAQGKTDGKSPEKRNQVLVDKTENLDFDVAKLTWEG